MTKKIINPAPVRQDRPFFNFTLRAKYIFLTLIGFVFYANSILNKYALDDIGVILENDYVQMGVAGIPKILTHDLWSGYYKYMGSTSSSRQLSGGRFRPLSEIMFAIEQQLFGGSVMLPYFSHLVNVLAYLACIIAMFYFLEKNLLKKIPMGSDIAFLATLLFAIHPLHTEVVANIKSLDEILSLFFILLTLIYSLKYIKDRKIKYIVIGTGSFLLALLSKEYAVTLLFFIPFLFYLLEDKNPGQALKASIPYYGIFFLYLLVRYNAVGFYHSDLQGTNLLSNPYLYATPVQKAATEWFVLGKYLGLLFFPYPLSCDYAYCQIPYHSFSDITVLLSIVIYTGIFVWGIMLTREKSVLSFAVFFFLFNIFMISNFMIDIGATLGERLAFHSSFGFVILVSYCLFNGSMRLSGISLQVKKSIVIGTISVIGIVCFGETVVRNAQWKNDRCLFIHDAGVVPNSCAINNNAGNEYLMLSEKNENTKKQADSYLDSARKYLFRALHFNPENELTYRNLGIMYLHREMLDSAAYCFGILKKRNPSHPDLKLNYGILSQLYFTRGLHLAMRNGRPREGIILMKKALLIDSANADIWYNIGIAYYHIQQYDSARYAFMETLQCKPDSMDATNAKKDLQDLMQMKEQ